MSGGAMRSALQTLRRDLEAARLGRDLLDDKREVILRTLLERAPRHAAARAAAVEALDVARRHLGAAVIENGSKAVAAAALAQPLQGAVEWRSASVVGVPTPALTGTIPAFAPRYGAAPLTAELDVAGEDFSAAIAALIAFAEEEAAVRNLQLGLSKTIRRLRALEHVVIPGIERRRRSIAAAVEEDERDDTVRSRQAGVSRRGS